MNPRPESPMMRTLRQRALDAHQVGAFYLLAMALGVGVMLSVFVGAITMLVDFVQGNAQTVLPQIVAVLEWLDGRRP